MTSIDALDGLPCTLNGQAGTAALTWNGSAQAVVTCGVATTPPPPPPPPPPPGPTTIRVNEVMTGAPSSAANEFVELVNTGTTAVDVGGWKIVYRSAAATSDVSLVTIPAGTTIAPGGFFLAGGAAYGGTAPADAAFATGLAAAGGAVGVRDAAGALVDSVGYGTATNAFVEGTPASAPASGQSIGRHPDGHDTDDNGVDFTVATTPTPHAAN